jgi:hypothetical protein
MSTGTGRVRVSTRDPGGLDSCSFLPALSKGELAIRLGTRCSSKNITSPDRRGHWPLVPPHVRHRAGIMSPVMKCTLRDRRSAARRSAERAALGAFSAAASVAAAAARALPRRSAHPGAPIPPKTRFALQCSGVAEATAVLAARRRKRWSGTWAGAVQLFVPAKGPHGGGGRILP